MVSKSENVSVLIDKARALLYPPPRDSYFFSQSGNPIHSGRKIIEPRASTVVGCVGSSFVLGEGIHPGPLAK